MSKWLHDLAAQTKQKADKMERERAEARRGRLGPVRLSSVSRGDLFALLLLVLAVTAAIAVVVVLA